MSKTNNNFKSELSSKNMYEANLKQVVCDNLNNLINKLKKLGLHHNYIASDILGITQQGLNKYLNGTSMPSITNLKLLCDSDKVKEKGYNICIDDFTKKNFNFTSSLSTNDISIKEIDAEHNDFCANYYVYFYDQTKSYKETEDFTREFRYGVISIYPKENSDKNSTKLDVFALFFKKGEQDKVVKTKNKLDEIYNIDVNKKIDYDKLYKFVSSQKNRYIGEIRFSDDYAFISIRGNNKNDDARITLYSPKKKEERQYIGGIGASVSISGGKHKIILQKVILSRLQLFTQYDRMAKLLLMYNSDVNPTEEIKSVCELAKQLYGENSTLLKGLNDSDKEVLLGSRIAYLSKKYVENNNYAISAITIDEDKKVFHLIQNSVEK